MTDAAIGGSRRAYLTALVALAAGAALALVGYGLVWVTAEVPLLPGADLLDGATRVQEFTGRDLYPGAAATGWLALASAGAVIATRSWWRTAVAAIGLVAGVTGGTVAVVFAATSGAAAMAGVTADLGGPATVPTTASPNWLVALAGALAVTIAALWTIVRGREWPAMGSRYERPRPGAGQASAWDVLDRGEDPTADPTTDRKADPTIDPGPP